VLCTFSVTVTVGVGFTVIVSVCAEDVPHPFCAVTETVPPVEPAVVPMVSTVEVPVQPEGIVHIYEVAPATGETEYVLFVPEQTVGLPEIVPGVAGILPVVTESACADEVPQLLVAVTVMVPPEVPVVELIEFVVEVPVHEAGSVHVYEVAVGSLTTEYVSGLPLHTILFPETEDGVAGIVCTVTASVCAALVPQELVAVTEMVPPEVPAVELIVLVVEAPVHVAGKLQVYEVTVGSFITEYDWVVPSQIVVLPVIDDGVAGTVRTSTVKVCAAEVPHILLAVTLTVPPPALAVVGIELVVDAPPQPPGNDQV
jgi:hypothetical protein